MGTPVPANRFYVFADELREWRLDAPPPVSWPDCRYFAAVLRAVDAGLADGGLNFILTKRVEGSLPLIGEDVVVVCIGDELCRMPAYAHDVRLVAKTYGVQRTPNVLKGTWESLPGLGATLAQEAIVQLRRAPSHVASRLQTLRRGRRPLIVDVPLGTYLLADVPFVPFDDRKFDVSYAGSRFNRQKEGRRRVPTQKARSRRDLEATLLRLPELRPDLRVAVHVIEEFRDAPTHSSFYSDLLMNSRIALCPRGGSLETYRFFEALQCGCVPVTERLPRRDYYTGAPGWRLDRWADLPDALDRLTSDGAALRAMHEAALRWWMDGCSPVAVGQRLIGHLERS